MDKYSLRSIHLVKDELLYQEAKKIRGDKVGWQGSTDIGIDKKQNEILVQNTVKLVNIKNSEEIYANYIVGFVYHFNVKSANEKELVAKCIWDSLAVLKGMLFNKLLHTPLESTIFPTEIYEEILKGLEIVKSLPKKTKKAKTKARA